MNLNLPYSQNAIDAMKASLAAKKSLEELKKAGITQATGLNYYDLRAPALIHVPILTPIRDRLERVSRDKAGTAHNWKVITGMTGSGYDVVGFVPEGQRSGAKSTQTADASSAYTTLGEEGFITDEALNSGRGLEDNMAIDTLMTLEKLQLKEEASLLIANKSTKLGTAPTPTLGTATDENATINTTVYVSVVALTPEGYQLASLEDGVATTVTTTGQDGKSYTTNGGSSNKSTSASQAVTTGNALTAKVAPVKGAVAYAWYAGTSNSAAALFLQGITTINSIKLESLLDSGQAASAITADCSYNDGTQSGSNPVKGYDGLLMTALSSGSGAYYLPLADGTLGTGTPLTSNGRGGCVEVDNLFLGMWNSRKITPDILFMSANTITALSNKCLNATSGPLLRINQDANSQNGFDLTGGAGVIKWYFSPIGTPYGGGKAAVMLHPFLPDGVIVGWSSQLPPHYKNSETPAVAQVITRQDYHSIDWVRTTRRYEYGVYTDQTLAVFAPWAMGVITNINVNG
jgi:hypothetical protein